MDQNWARVLRIERCGPVWTRTENDSNSFYLFGYDETRIHTIQFVKFVISLLFTSGVSNARAFINKPKRASSFHQHLPFLRDLCRSCFIRPYLSVDWHRITCRSLKTQRHRLKHKHTPLPLSHSVTVSVLQDDTGSMIVGAWIQIPEVDQTKEKFILLSVWLAHLPTGKAAVSANGVLR